MLRSELIKRIVEATPGLHLGDGERAISAVLGTTAIALERGDRVELRGFGVFSAKRRRSRNGHNPRNGVVMAVPEKRAVAFNSARQIRRRLNP